MAPLKKSQTDATSSPLQALSVPALVILNPQHIVLLWLHLSRLASHVIFILTRLSHHRSTMSSSMTRASRRLHRRARVPCASSRCWTGSPLMLCCQIVRVSCGRGRMEIGLPLFAPLRTGSLSMCTLVAGFLYHQYVGLNQPPKNLSSRLMVTFFVC
jgi:hypothetical protein